MNEYQEIKLKTKDSCCIFISNRLVDFWGATMWTNRKMMLKMFNTGVFRLIKELNMIRLIKNIRNQKILMKMTMVNENVEELIGGSKKVFINLDSSNDDEKDLHKSIKINKPNRPSKFSII